MPDFDMKVKDENGVIVVTRRASCISMFTKNFRRETKVFVKCRKN